MAIISTIITTVVGAFLLAAGGTLCAPCSSDFKRCMEDLYEKFKSCIVVPCSTGFTTCVEDSYMGLTSCVEIFFKPASNDDLNNLRTMVDGIMSIIPSEDRDQWISDANNIMARYNSSSTDQNDGRQSFCLIGDKCLRSSLLSEMKKLLKKGKGIITRQPLKFEYIHDISELSPFTVADMTLDEAMLELCDDQVRRIRIWGHQEIGKTPVVRAMNNKLVETRPGLFSCIIYVPETENVHEEYVQKAISKRLKLQVDETMDTKKIAEQILERLKKVKFLLILDNLSISIDLEKIGVPKDCGMSKIVLEIRASGKLLERKERKERMIA